MGKYCEICAKGKMSGHNVSHSNRKSNRIWVPNVQSVRVVIGGTPMRINVCTRCLRSGYVQRAMPALKVAPVEEAAVAAEE